MFFGNAEHFFVGVLDNQVALFSLDVYIWVGEVAVEKDIVNKPLSLL
jgi:hypothetical protein